MTGAAPSLPTGGGAIAGIGETFQPDLHTGTGNLTLPIPLPPGRGELSPHLSLGYSSGSGNGPFGLGWSLSVPQITRRTDKGVPTYDDDLDVFVLSGAEELVPVPLGTGAPANLPADQHARRYRPRTETGFARILHVTGPTTDYWDVWTPDGLRSRYGTSRDPADDPDWEDQATVRNPDSRVLAWLLTETTDTFGNRIDYTYDGDTGPQRYLATVSYADYGDPRSPIYAVSVTVRYDLTARPDPFTDRKPGFALSTTRRAVALEIATVGSSGSPVTTVELGYGDEQGGVDGDGSSGGHSLLRSIQVVGHDSSTGTEQRLPPLTFNYRGWNPTRRQYRTLADPVPPGALGNGTDLVDLFAHGLPSVLELNGSARYWRNRGGAFERPQTLTGAPTGAALGAPGTLLSDLDGDGRVEISTTDVTATAVWHLKDPSVEPVDQPGFTAPTFAETTRTGLDATAPGVRLIDLSGTHIPDLLISGTVPLTAAGDGYGGFTNLRPLPHAPPPASDLADPRVRLADMSGDGLTDLVLVHDGAVRYWPNLGHGRFDDPVDMSGAPTFTDPASDQGLGFDPRRLLLGDLTGDGTADAVYVDDGATTLWLNQSGNGFAPPTVIRGTPRVSNTTAVRLADLDGTGVSGILWTGVGMGETWAFLDPCDGVKPYLLTDVDNHRGATTTLTWSTSTAFATADRDAGRPWRTALPFPVHVLARTETRDDFAHTLLSEQYGYHDGYWDPIDREFRGFGRVEHTDTLTPTQPAPPGRAKITPLDPLVPKAPLPAGFDPALHGNLLRNWSFDRDSDGSPTTLTTTTVNPAAGGSAAAAEWTMWNNSPATTTTSLQESTLPHGAGGDMLHVTTTAAGCGIVQTFLPSDQGPTRAVASVWVYIVRGAVQVGTGNGGNTGADAVCAEHSQWVLVEVVNTHAPANEIVVYAADAEGADFYVDHAWVRIDDSPSDHFTSPPVRTVKWFHTGPVGPAQGPWTAPDSSHEYWQGDPPLADQVDLAMPADMPRTAQREALRGVRGLVLRTETYTDDGLPSLSARPCEVRDAAHQVTPVLDGRSPNDPDWLARPVVTVRTTLTRTAVWDRGTEPMTTLTAAGGFDEYGRPHATATAAVPRGRDPRTTGSSCLATTTREDFATRDDATLFRLDRVCLRTRHEAVDPGTRPVLAFLADALSGSVDGTRRALELSYYDGDAFVGLPLRKLGEHGLTTRTEALTITPDLLTAMTQPTAMGAPGSAPIPYLPADGVVAPLDWGTGYPPAFRDAVMNAPESRGPTLGYLWHDDSAPVAAGYYTQTSRLAYDVQQTVPGATPRGLPIAAVDSHGGMTSTTWDTHQLLVTRTVDPVGLSTSVDYDYRVLKPAKITDPNGNRSVVGYTPLGLPAWVAHLGKDGQRIGDTLDQPAQVFAYDLTAWDDAAARGMAHQPMSVSVVKRVDHRWTVVAQEDAARAESGQPPLTNAESAALFGPTEQADHPDRFVRVTQFTDGHGRLLQTRTQADDAVISDLGLPIDASPATATVSIDPPADVARVIVSSWVVYDNKGRRVATYEPFFGTGYKYLEPTEAQLASLAVTQYRYDPLARPTVTTAPDGTQTRIVHGVPKALGSPQTLSPTPWEAYVYDPSDNTGRSCPTLDLLEVDHWDTPSSTVYDALGRTIQVTERGLAADATTTHTYDIDGRLLAVTDPLGRPVATHVYDLVGREWFRWVLDAGTVRTVHDAAGGVIEQRHDTGGSDLTEYDPAHRATFAWAADRLGQRPSLRHRVVYGDEPAAELSPEHASSANVIGRAVCVLDEAGRVTTSGYDLDGNPVATTRHIVRLDLLVSLLPPAGPGAWAGTAFPVDWPGAGQPLAQANALLDPVAYTTATQFDALGRRTATTFPVDATGARVHADYAYSRGGGLTSIKLDGTPYLHRAVFDARGRRVIEVSGNGVLQRYHYDPLSSHLRRHHAQCAEEASPGTWSGNGPVLTDQTYRHDPAGNVVTIADRTPGCGVPPGDPDRLDRQFLYDPLARIVSATGRETDRAPAQPWLDLPRSTDPTKARSYKEAYKYDPVGNLLELRHMTSPDGAYTRAFAIGASSNRLPSVTIGGLVVAYGYDAAGSITTEAANRFFEWDHARRLVTFRDQAGASQPSVYAQYRYDAGGKRVIKIVRRSSGPDEATLYIGEFERTLVGPLCGATTTADRIELSDVARRARINRGDVLPGDALSGHSSVYYLTDHLGSATATLDDAGSLLVREEYLPYGETAFGSYSRKRYRYTGRERDEESGLSYHMARYYQPGLARWCSCDPFGIAPDLNLYRYCRSNPVSKIDPRGRAPVDPPKYGGAPGKVAEKYQEGTYNRLKGYKINGTEPTIREHPLPQAQIQSLLMNPRTGVSDYRAHGPEGGRDAVYLSPKPEAYLKTHTPGSVPGDNVRTSLIKAAQAEAALGRGSGANFNEDIVQPSILRSVEAGAPRGVVERTILKQAGNLFETHTLTEAGAILRGEHIAQIISTAKMVTLDTVNAVGEVAQGINRVMGVAASVNLAIQNYDAAPPGLLFNKSATAALTFLGAEGGALIDDAMSALNPAYAPVVAQSWRDQGAGPAAIAAAEGWRELSKL